MAEIRPSEISEILKGEIKGFEGNIAVRETGRVLTCGDGIAPHCFDQLAPRLDVVFSSTA